MYMRARAKPEFQTTDLYTGKHVNINMERDEFTIMELEECALWLFQFYNPDVRFYFGVMDVDVDTEKYDLNDYGKELETKVKHEFPGMPYDIYFSGNRGYHVYLYDARFWVKPDRYEKDKIQNWILATVKSLYGNLFEIIDTSIYTMNHGIRPYTINHPVTNKRPKLCARNHTQGFWHWMMDTMRLPPNIIPLLDSVEQTIGTQLSTNASVLVNTTKQKGDQMNNIVIAFYKDKTGGMNTSIAIVQ